MKWMKRSFVAIQKYDTLFFKGALAGIFIMAIPAAAGIAEGRTTGLGWIHYAAVILLGLLALAISAIMSAGLLTLLRLPVPRLFVSALAIFIYGFQYVLTYLSIDTWGAVLVASSFALCGIIAGSSTALLIYGRRWRRVIAGYFIVSVVAAVYGAVWLFGPGLVVYPPDREWAGRAAAGAAALAAENPALVGPYVVEHYNYGSGNDPRRKEFAEDTDYVTATVDASSFLTGWRKAREWYWNFDPSSLPLNGRVWMPQGEGRFPLVLILHGSDYMEHPSDEGYAYLGQLLASKGYIAVSVDETFINYSVWSGNLDRDMEIRAWLLLQHLHAIGEANDEPGNLFSGKVDMANVALIGHSRGGQAAVLAAVFDDYYGDSEEITAPPMPEHPIRSIIAIAPIDKWLDGKLLRLYNTNYLTIQGAMDADVNSFSGDRQFRRTVFTGSQYLFKASLYIQGANHGQFNTVWGDSDVTAPTHYLLNKADMLPGDEQRRIAEVYVSAFLDATLRGRSEYIPMFRDYRKALQWLPSTVYVSRFEDSRFLPMGRFEEDTNKTTMARSGLELSADHVAVWEEEDVKNRQNNTTRNKAVKLRWEGKKDAAYTIDFEPNFVRLNRIGDNTVFAFSLANADADATDFEASPIMLEMLDGSGRSALLPLSDVMPVPPVIRSRFTKSLFFEKHVKKGRIGAEFEPVFQSFEVPLAELQSSFDGWDASSLSAIRFVFPEGSRGTIYLDDFGLYNM